MTERAIQPRTLTTSEQQQLVDVLYQQRLIQDQLHATGLTPEQEQLLRAIWRTRLDIRQILDRHITHQAVSAPRRRRPTKAAPTTTLIPAQLSPLG